MKFSLIPPVSVINSVREWLLAILESDGFNDLRFPTSFIGFINDAPIQFAGGYWSHDGQNFFIGQDDGGTIHPLDKLSALIIVATWARIINEQIVVTALTRGYSREILKGFKTLFDGLIFSNEPIRRLAFHPSAQVAAEFEGQGWFAPNGTAVELNDEWTVVEGPEPAAQPTIAAE